MFTFLWLLGILLCAIELYIIRNSPLDKKVRENDLRYWEDYSWESTDKTVKISRGLIIIYGIFSLVPYINIMLSVIVFIYCFLYNIEPKGNDGWKRVIYRFHFAGKTFDWLKEKV